MTLQDRLANIIQRHTEANQQSLSITAEIHRLEGEYRAIEALVNEQNQQPTAAPEPPTTVEEQPAAVEASPLPEPVPLFPNQ